MVFHCCCAINFFQYSFFLHFSHLRLEQRWFFCGFTFFALCFFVWRHSVTSFSHALSRLPFFAAFRNFVKQALFSRTLLVRTFFPFPLLCFLAQPFFTHSHLPSPSFHYYLSSLYPLSSSPFSLPLYISLSIPSILSFLPFLSIAAQFLSILVQACYSFYFSRNLIIPFLPFFLHLFISVPSCCSFHLFHNLLTPLITSSSPVFTTVSCVSSSPSLIFRRFLT